jgi:hypothetical protein
MTVKQSALWLLMVGCGGAVQPVSLAPAPETRSVEETATTVEERPVEPEAVAVADAPPATPARACGAWGSGNFEAVVRVSPSLVAILHTLEPLGPHGYDGMDQVHVLELREVPSLALRLRRVVDPYPITMAASADGSLVAVASHSGTTLFATSDGSVVAALAGPAYALAFASSGELAISHGESVDVLDASTHTVSRTIAITGGAPTVIHAMRMDGECDEIFETTGARASVLTYVGDALFAGVSDGSVRRLEADDSVRFTRDDAQQGRGYARETVAMLPAAHDHVRAIWSDGVETDVDARTLTLTARRASACTAAELRSLAGRDVEVTAEACPQVARVIVDGARTLFLGGAARVRGPGGASLLSVPTLHTQGAILAGDEAWLFGNDGTTERWPLGGTSRFLGGVPVEGRVGYVVEVSSSGRFVVTGLGALTPWSNEQTVVTLHVWDTHEERERTDLGARGHVARFIDGDRRIAIDLDDGHRRAVEVREVSDGSVVRRVTLGTYEYGGLFAADETRIVIAEDARVRVVSIADGSERAFELAPCALERAELRGNRLALLVYDRVTGDILDHRVEVLDLSGDAITAVAHADDPFDAGLAFLPGSDRVAYVARGGVATVLDVATGARGPLEAVPDPTGYVGLVGGEWLALHDSPTGGRRGLLRGAPAGPPVLSLQRVSDRERSAILYELGGAAYVIGHDGRTRASLHALDDGLVIEAVDGTFAVMGDARRSLAPREGEMLVACDARFEDLHRPGLLESLLAAYD